MKNQRKTHWYVQVCLIVVFFFVVTMSANPGNSGKSRVFSQADMELLTMIEEWHRVRGDGINVGQRDFHGVELFEERASPTPPNSPRDGRKHVTFEEVPLLRGRLLKGFQQRGIVFEKSGERK